MYIKRFLDIKKHLEQKSVLLLGPRRTGTSSFIQAQIKPDLYFNLLETTTFSQLAYDPGILKKAKHRSWPAEQDNLIFYRLIIMKLKTITLI